MTWLTRLFSMNVNLTINGCDCAGPPHGRIVFGLGPVTEQVDPPTKTSRYRRRIREDGDFVATLSVVQQLTITVKGFKDRKGNAAKVDGAPTWATDNSEILAITPAPDGMSCLVAAVGMIGQASVQATADADLGPGVTQLIGTVDFDVTAGQAATIDLEVGAPGDQP